MKSSFSKLPPLHSPLKNYHLQMNEGKLDAGSLSPWALHKASFLILCFVLRTPSIFDSSFSSCYILHILDPFFFFGFASSLRLLHNINSYYSNVKHTKIDWSINIMRSFFIFRYVSLALQSSLLLSNYSTLSAFEYRFPFHLTFQLK